MSMSNEESVRRCPQPSHYKMALLRFVGMLAPAYFIPPSLSAVISGPRLFTSSVTVAVIVLLMSYIIMPVLMSLSHNWLYEQSGSNSQISGD